MPPLLPRLRRVSRWMLRNNEFALGRDYDLSIEGFHSRSKGFAFYGAGFVRHCYLTLLNESHIIMRVQIQLLSQLIQKSNCSHIHTPTQELQHQKIAIKPSKKVQKDKRVRAPTGLLHLCRFDLAFVGLWCPWCLPLVCGPGVSFPSKLRSTALT